MTLVHLEPAAKFGSPDLAKLLNRCYEGYEFPVNMDPYALEAFCRERDVDLSRSLVAFNGPAPAGLALVAVRGTAGYLAELGVTPEVRGHGVGHALLDAVLAGLADAGAARATLEVLEHNATAIKLYERAGFVETRRLPCYRAPALVGRNLDVREVPLGALRPLARADAAWQNAYASAAHASARGFTHPEGGHAIAKIAAEGILLYDVHGPDPGAVLDGLGALFPGKRATHLNVVDGAVEEALRRRGWQRYVTQIEMERPLP